MVDSNKSMAFGRPTVSDVVVDQTKTEVYSEIAKRQENVCYVCFTEIGNYTSKGRQVQKATSTFDILTGQKTTKYPPLEVPTARIHDRNRHLFHRPIHGSANQPYAMTEKDSEKIHGWSIRLNRFL